MKKAIYALILLLVVASGIVWANREVKNETTVKPAPRPLSTEEMNAERKAWEASSDGIRFKQWETSPAGTKVLSAAKKIKAQVNASSDMEAVVTSLSLPPGSRLGFGIMVRINDDDYILSFGVEEKNEFQPLQNLQVNDKIIIRSNAVSYAPKYAYPIVAGDYVEKDGKMIYKRAPRKGGC